mgnify:CR=1 FL=1
MSIIHASCVSVNNKAILLLGDSGSGKSDLALRMIDSGALLVADDYVEIKTDKNRLIASPPKRLEGLIEARGVGILTLPFIRDIEVKLAVNLVAREKIERMPEQQFFDCLEHKLPLLSLHAFDASTPAKIRFFIDNLT